jgi:DNA gyrase subunit B
MDCTTSDQGSSELFLVEGDSAGGTAEGGRDRMYQAILPLRGKILNVERARLDKVLGNEEVRNIIMAVGGGIGDDPVTGNDPSKRRYGKVVLMSDADVDGAHIRTLLMTFFYRQMPRLVAEGHLYVAQPPLYMITQKKERKYVQAEGEMNAILIGAGLGDAELQPFGAAEETRVGGEKLRALVELGAAIENSLRVFGRRNIPLRSFLKMAHTETGLLPQYIVDDRGVSTPLYSEDDLITYRKNHPGAVADEYQKNPTPEDPVEPGVSVTELHEVRTLNKHLARLRDEYGLRAEVLLPVEITGDEPPPRFVLLRAGDEHVLSDLRELVPTVRRLGEKGLKVTRFKGLGEMDADQLWDTTMDPTRRTLMQVKLDDAAAANDLFTTLMGDDVEPRRDFIEKHALEVKNLDV